ncbi:hypothetical protein [Mesorhizobium silamurunense]|uniref:hypothetical protein n=1 Tax=Mesorhizobium silamurunense TaxID=499528 RepID=UPI00177FA4F6|nr:hypothetical protein [Mesorhizobium silamurunense]
MRWILGLLVAPICLALLAVWADADLQNKTFVEESPTIWSLLGYILTYWGFCLSGIAAYEVTRLSRRYVGRTRMPELRKSLGADTSVFLGKADAPIAELLSDGVVARLSANLRAVKSHPQGASVRTATTDAVAALKRFKKVATKTADSGAPISQNVGGFWAVHMALEELDVEIDNYLRDERKRKDVQ